jgi:hypothetical protein
MIRISFDTPVQVMRFTIGGLQGGVSSCWNALSTVAS